MLSAKQARKFTDAMCSVKYFPDVHSLLLYSLDMVEAAVSRGQSTIEIHSERLLVVEIYRLLERSLIELGYDIEYINEQKFRITW